MVEKYKTISIKPETYDALVKEGKNLHDTFDIVISRLIHTSKDAAAVASAGEDSK